jgi:methyl-accepting chemotaxis protein-1 (serine sensor receptor)
MFKNITIRARLALAMSFLGLLLIIGGAMGIGGVLMSNDNVKSLYSNQLGSSVALGDASVALARTRLWLFRIAIDPSAATVPQYAQNARVLLDRSKKSWAAYRALPSADADEERQANEVTQKLENLVTVGLDPIFQAISSGDANRIRETVLNASSAQYIDVTGSIDALLAKQAKVARETYQTAQLRFQWFVGIALAGIAFALAAAALAWRSLQRAIGRPLQEALTHFQAIADGDLTTRVEVRSQDEMGQLMRGLQTMQGKLIETISVVRENAGNINTAAQEIAAGNTDLSQRTEEQAASLEETASSDVACRYRVRDGAAGRRRGRSSGRHDE